MRAKRTNRVAVALFFTLLASPNTAQAYLDAGTGSVLVQLLLGGLVGIGALAKLYWSQIKDFLGFGEEAPPEPPGQGEPEAEGD